MSLSVQKVSNFENRNIYQNSQRSSFGSLKNYNVSKMNGKQTDEVSFGINISPKTNSLAKNLLTRAGKIFGGSLATVAGSGLMLLGLMLGIRGCDGASYDEGRVECYKLANWHDQVDEEPFDLEEAEERCKEEYPKKPFIYYIRDLIEMGGALVTLPLGAFTTLGGLAATAEGLGLDKLMEEKKKNPNANDNKPKITSK